MTSTEWNEYISALRSGRFLKICRLRFLNPDGSAAFVLDNDPANKRSGAFIESGSLNANQQNGTRRTVDVKLANVDEEFSYNYNKVWFGTEIALDMGMLTPSGTELWFPQGVFRVTNPNETVNPNEASVSFSLTDKWAGIDGTLHGNLETTYIVTNGTNIFTPIASILASDRGDGQPYDNVAPIFTEYYNGKTQIASDGSTVAVTDAPYTLTVDRDDGTVADVVLGLCEMLNAWVGYDPSGRLRVDPSQDDILDSDKPVAWRFSLDEAQAVGLAYQSKIEDVKNDYIVVGFQMEDYTQPAARVQNLDPASDTNINLIGRRTKRESRNEFATNTICEDYAVWMLKRTAILHKAITIQCNQIFHMDTNELVEIIRTDRATPTQEIHLVQSFTLPLTGTDTMTITATSVHDFPDATVTTWPPAS